MISYDNLWPAPNELCLRETFSPPNSISLNGDVNDLIERTLKESRLNEKIHSKGDFKIFFELKDTKDSENSDESYCVQVTNREIRVIAAGRAGLYYGSLTLRQLFDVWHTAGAWRKMELNDAPAFKKRAFMVDMGRSVFSMSFLKRIIRLLAALKMNQLHLHLFDDELCGIRFRGHDFGKDNPYAITIEQLGELVEYAGRYHVEIVPELEGWAHVGSITHHRPELRGGDGVYNGSSFLISESVLELMRDLIRQTAEVLPDKATIHMGLDEAKWFLDPTMPRDFSPETFFIRYAAMIKEIGAELGKELTMRMWHDHRGRVIPDEIKNDVIVEPWNYWNHGASAVDEQVAYFSKAGMRWMIGAGQSMGQYRGVYHATRHWCRQAVDKPGVEGVNITFWGRNDLDNHLITLFAGAYYLWNPKSTAHFADLEDYEAFDLKVFPIMRKWQSTFKDAFPDDLAADRGPNVYNGYYWGGESHGKPVSPCVAETDTLFGHDFLNE